MITYKGQNVDLGPARELRYTKIVQYLSRSRACFKSCGLSSALTPSVTVPFITPPRKQRPLEKLSARVDPAPSFRDVTATPIPDPRTLDDLFHSTPIFSPPGFFSLSAHTLLPLSPFRGAISSFSSAWNPLFSNSFPPFPFLVHFPLPAPPVSSSPVT